MPAAYEAQCDLLIKKSYTGHEQQLERGGGDSGGPVGRAHLLDATLGATPHEPQWRAHFRKIVRAFGARLFPCYDQPQIPRTNNDMEQALRELSTRERRGTGRKHVGPKLVRIQGLVCAAELLVHDVTAHEPIAGLPSPERRGFQTRRRRLATPRRQARAFRRKPAEFLATVEQL